jgi:Protein of unknown function (DUF2637)
MWERLPQHLRAGLVLSVIALIGAAAGGFLLSFVALREVAGNHITGWTDYAWVFPVTTDFGLVACEVTFLTLSMMRGTGLQQIVVGFFMLVFGAFTIYFNTSRIPADMAQWRMVTGAPPAFGIVLTLIFAILLKAFVRHIGKDWAVSGGNEQVGDRGVVRGYISRPAQYGIFPNGQNGHEINGNGVSKKRLVEQYLDEEVPPEDLRRITGREIAEELSNRGTPMTAQTANGVLQAYRKRHGIRVLRGRR